MLSVSAPKEVRDFFPLVFLFLTADSSLDQRRGGRMPRAIRSGAILEAVAGGV